MPRLTKIYTRTGDDGTTGLGTGKRVAKDAARVEAYGTVDELSAQIGLAIAARPQPELAEPLARIQNDLFHLGADLCIPDPDKPNAPGPRIEARHVRWLEELMDRLGEELPELKNFVLPGGTLPAAHLHAARTICRRAERRVVSLLRHEPVSETAVTYLNRLSDALFVVARYENHRAGVSEPTWDSRA